MDLKAFLALGEFNLHQISQRTGIAYSTLANHVNHGKGVSVATAKKLEAFDHRLSAATILGLAKVDSKPAA